MCIRKVDSYEYKGVLYSSEWHAIQAGIQQISARLMKDYSDNLASGLRDESTELIYLLQAADRVEQEALERQKAEAEALLCTNEERAKVLASALTPDTVVTM